MSVPNCVPFLGGNESRYLLQCIETGWVSSVGPFVDQFERDFAAYHGLEKAVSVSSGTAAIHLGLLELGVRPGDLVICPTLTFVGTTNPARYCGADVVLLDSEEESLNMDPNCLSDFLQKETDYRSGAVVHRSTGRRISAVVAVHLYGNPAKIVSLMEVAAAKGVPVLEDATESLGALTGDRRVGTIADIGCFSFNGNKVITTGGGGMLIGRNARIMEHAKHLSTTARTDPFDFIHDEVGYNYRLSNLCAAVGVAQLEQLDGFVAKKRAHAAAYTDAFSRAGRWAVVAEPHGTVGSYWMTLARPADTRIPSVLDLVRACAQQGVGVRPAWKPLHTVPAYQDAIYFGGDTAERLYNTTFCLPSSVGLSEEEMHQTVRVLDRAFSPHHVVAL